MYIADTITDEQSSNLADVLNNDNMFTERMKAEGRNGKECLLEFFRSNSFNLKWIQLKAALLSLDMASIVDHIEAKFLYIQGNSFSSRLIID